MFATGALLLFLLVPPCISTADHAFLTEDEQRWLAAHPKLRLAPGPSFQPIEYFDEQGHYQGITADYIALIEKKLGVVFDKIQHANREQVFNSDGIRELDIWTTVLATPQRHPHMNFTRPYLSLPAVILVRDPSPDAPSLETLRGMKVCVMAGDGIQDYILKQFPEIVLEVVPDVQTGLRKVSQGRVDAMVSNIALATAYMEKERITNLRLSEEPGYRYQWVLASRNDWPELNRILDKALAQITPDEQKAIHSKWIVFKIPGKDFRDIALSLVVFLGVLLIAAVLFWNRSLTRQVDRRTRELKEELAERREIESALRESENQYRTLYNQLKLVVQGTSSATGEEFFKSLVHHLALAFKVKYAFVSEWVDREKGLVQTLAFWNAKGFSENITYNVANTPCENVMRGEWTSYPKGVRKLFPKDQFLQEFNIEGYQGIPILDHSGNVLGHLGIMDGQPIQEAPINSMILAIFASRACAELVRNQVEHRLIEAKEYAEEASRAKTEFLSRMSHELRTPLNAILGFGQLLQMKRDKMSPDDIESIDHIMDSGNHLLELINEVLDLSQIESGQLVLQSQNIPLAPLMHKTFDLFLPIGKEQKIEMVNNISDQDSIEVSADPLRLKQVLTNLLSNAIKYNKPGGKVVVEGNPVKSGKYRISVKDTGFGISKDQMKHLFKPFERLGRENSKIEGTGIGLTICQSLMKIMKGSLTVESIPGQGSCFFLEVPLAPGQPKPSSITVDFKNVAE